VSCPQPATAELRGDGTSVNGILTAKPDTTRSTPDPSAGTSSRPVPTSAFEVHRTPRQTSGTRGVIEAAANGFDPEQRAFRFT
jgi:hypothetical protein